MKVQKSLQDLVKKTPGIKEVYFDENGDHYFQKHKVIIHEDNGNGLSIGTKEVECLPGVKDNVLKVKQPNGVIIDKKVHVEYKEIAATLTREQILNADAYHPELTNEDEARILAQAAEIMKKRGPSSEVKKVDQVKK